ncbi:hypothetical protein [Streptomyces sp. NPDC001508]|uniref:PASTA domain-containing protein n=1 Tax=Streptomyces sp. NPDC001508 TaxID=3154656 RepID=UPI0033174E4F
MRKGPALLTLAVVVALFALSQHAGQQRAELPDLHGMTLREAQLAARNAGFGQLAGADALDHHRIPLWGDNWKVCSQQPAPARYVATTLITVGVVKTSEACPSP